MANTGAGSVLLTILPDEVSGNSSSTTICAGTMYSGNHALSRCRTAPISMLVFGLLACTPRPECGR
ncbi:hypothetical protein [Mycobacterium tilburgii]|uniref:hypothetical protein n=1 Tax=Mycobacterium tilburgii TaxID=44467 RepID=UPI0021B2F0DC|nr:hypothetical protein [Mycobacterium tilburgii]